MVDTSGVQSELRRLWERDKPDYGRWSVDAIHFLAERYKPESGHHLQGSRVLYSTGDFESPVGELLAINEGIVLFRGLYADDFGGLLRRIQSRHWLFWVESVTTDGFATIRIGQNPDGSAKLETASGHGGHDSGARTEVINAQRWAELKAWLDRWLPEEA